MRKRITGPWKIAEIALYIQYIKRVGGIPPKFRTLYQDWNERVAGIFAVLGA